jgi:hypothetical protein
MSDPSNDLQQRATVKHDHNIAQQWAQDRLNNGNFCILDVAITSNSKDDAQICQIAVIEETGNLLLDSLVCPTVPIQLSARSLHGISDRDVAGQPTFDEILVPLLKAIGAKEVVVYNIETMRLIIQSIAPYGIELLFPIIDRRANRIFLNGRSIHAVKPKYELWAGCDSANILNGSALANCRTTLGIIRQMATEGEAA